MIHNCQSVSVLARWGGCRKAIVRDCKRDYLICFLYTRGFFTHWLQRQSLLHLLVSASYHRLLSQPLFTVRRSINEVASRGADTEGCGVPLGGAFSSGHQVRRSRIEKWCNRTFYSNVNKLLNTEIGKPYPAFRILKVPDCLDE